MNKLVTSKKKNLKIAAATGMAVFSLISVFVATYAWFTALPNVEGNGISIMVSQDKTGRLGYVEIHECLSTETIGGQKTYLFDENPYTTLTYNWADGTTSVTGNTGNFPLGDYSPLLSDHPLLMVFAMLYPYTSVAEGDMYIKGATDVSGFLGSTNDNGDPLYTLGDQTATVFRKRDTSSSTDYYALSSVVNFRCADFDQDGYDALFVETADSTEQNPKHTINIGTNSLDKPKSFVDLNGEHGKPQFTKKPTLYSSLGTGKTVQYIALVVNYDSDAISAIYTTYLGDTTLYGAEYGGTLHFTCDWSLEVY